MSSENTQNLSGFNPIKETVDGKKAHSVIWSTRTLEMALDGLQQGKRLIANPFYENNTKLLKGDLVFQRTPEEEAEFLKCMNDIVYFANTYCKLMTPEGVKKVQMRDYQMDYLKHLSTHQLSIFLSCRQSAKTTTSAIFMIHYILFNVDKNTLVLGNKRRTAVEILSKLKSIFYELPYFLKPGIYKWNESEIVLDNGCRCMAEATTVNSGISFTFHCVLADEFAHIAPNILDKFYNQIFPTIVAGKAKFIISSTQNGFNLFQKLYTAAEEGENDYAPFRVDWWQVPEWNPDTHTWDKRDEAWHRRQAANLGGEEAFQAQFGTKFMVIANTLIDNVRMTTMMSEAQRYINKYLPGVIGGDTYYFWRPDFEPTEDLRRNKIIITIDLSEGVGRDSTVFMFWRCISDKKIECIGFFECPNIDLNSAAESLIQILNNFCSPDNTIVSMEYNTYGELFYKYLMDYIENGRVRFQDDIFVRYFTDNGRKSICGLKINSHNKPVLCTLFKQKFESGEIVNQAFQFMRQLENFSDVKNNGSYQAVIGHDDLVMASVQLVGVMDTLRFRDLVDSILSEGSDNNYDYYNFGQQNPWMNEMNQMMSQAQTMTDIYSGFSQDFDNFQDNNLKRLRRL